MAAIDQFGIDIEKVVKTLCRELEVTAKDMENHGSQDHATAAAAYAGAEAIRRVAGTIGWILLGTEDFREDKEGDDADSS